MTTNAELMRQQEIPNLGIVGVNNTEVAVNLVLALNNLRSKVVRCKNCGWFSEMTSTCRTTDGKEPADFDDWQYVKADHFCGYGAK